MYYSPSELIINNDNSIFHLHLRPDQIAGKIILVGDPGRVSLVAKHFDNIECDVQNREYHTITGTFEGKRISVVSTGIGIGNIDIVLNELDALANIDFATRAEKSELVSLELVRIGTCGGLQPTTPIGTFISSVKSIGLDGLLNYYEGRDAVCDVDLEKEFVRHMQWQTRKGSPYVAIANKELTDRIASTDMVKGITVTCGGFFGPQGRRLRIALADPEQNEKIEKFCYDGLHILNLEMESSAVAGLAGLLGHKATTCCMVIANRRSLEANTNYKNTIDTLITKVLERI